MTQLFADDEQLDEASGPVTAGRPMIRQRTHGDFGPALTAGKGVRAVRCIGCSEAPLPRTGATAPHTARCTDLLDGSQQRSSSLFSGRWRRRR